jgi:hypothetical protein
LCFNVIYRTVSGMVLPMSEAVGIPPLVIRRARPQDAAALAQVAALDEAPVPPEPLLVGEVGGRVWVAVSLVNLDHIADPFQRSGEIAALTVERARQLRGPPIRPRRAGRRRRSWGWRGAVRETLAGERP